MSDILVTTESIWALRVPDPTSGVVIAARKTAPTHEDPKLADVVARPKFSATARVAEAIEERLEERHRTRVEEQQRTHRVADRKSPRWRVSVSAGVSASAGVREGAADVVVWGNEGTSDLSMFAAYRNKAYLPVGLDMNGPSAEPGLSADAYTWHPAARASFAAARSASPPKVAHVFFPVLAAVLPKWINGFAGAEDAHGAAAPRRVETRRVLYLVSGYGAPVNASHAPESNSTEAMARVMKTFVELAYPGLIEVRLAHSGNGVFRYDKNVSFVTETLRPAVARDRDAVAAAFGEEWVRRFKLTVALCDGTPARLHALMSSFRDMRPYLAHAFRLKRFWHAGELDTGDVDIQRWARAEAAPPTRLDRLELVLRSTGAGASEADAAHAATEARVTIELVKEMKAHRDAFLNAAKEGAHELTSFWLRKTRKPVLAVLCVLKAASAAKPRGVIAARDFEFHRGVNLEVSMPTGSLCSERNAIGNALAANPSLVRKDMFGIAVLSLRARDVDRSGPGPGVPGGEDATVLCRDVSRPTDQKEPQTNTDTRTHDRVSMSRNASFAFVPNANASANGPNASDAADLAGLNPLRPCGACKEWLNKIAEVNPGFRVLMFSDVTCDEVYVKEVGQC